MRFEEHRRARYTCILRCDDISNATCLTRRHPCEYNVSLTRLTIIECRSIRLMKTKLMGGSAVVSNLPAFRQIQEALFR